MTAQSLGAVELIAREALRIAKNAENHALEAHHLVGQMAREMGLIRADITSGFARLEKQIGTARRTAMDSKHKLDEWESDSKVHLLNELKEEKKKRDALERANSAETRRWKWWALSIAAAIIAALLIDVIGHLAK